MGVQTVYIRYIHTIQCYLLIRSNKFILGRGIPSVWWFYFEVFRKIWLYQGKEGCPKTCSKSNNFRWFFLGGGIFYLIWHSFIYKDELATKPLPVFGESNKKKEERKERPKGWRRKSFDLDFRIFHVSHRFTMPCRATHTIRWQVFGASPKHMQLFLSTPHHRGYCCEILGAKLWMVGVRKAETHWNLKEFCALVLVNRFVSCTIHGKE